MNTIIACKSALLVIATVAHHLSLTAPTPTKRKEKAYDGQFFETAVLFLVHIVRLSVATLSASHIAIMFILDHPQPRSYAPVVMSRLCPQRIPDLGILSSLNATFLVGVALTAFALLLRLWCYTELGEMFTFLVTLKSKHTLVTSGPYAWVRHPSYTAVFLLEIGIAATCFAPGSYMSECALLQTRVLWLVAFWATATTFTFVSLWNRGKVEDELMKSTFGDQWVEWSRRVRWRFFPGLF